MSKIIQVKVIKRSGDKTIIGETVSLQKHPIYKKYVKKYTKYMIHDENNLAKIGDEILITETKPISKKKVWIMKSIVNSDKGE